MMKKYKRPIHFVKISWYSISKENNFLNVVIEYLHSRISCLSLRPENKSRFLLNDVHILLVTDFVISCMSEMYRFYNKN